MKISNILIYENGDFVVLNKPWGLPSIPDREGKEISLRKLLQEERTDVFTVHRLDRDTSGVIVFAKNEATHKFLSQQFERRLIQKFYLGLVIGSPLRKQDSINFAIMEHPSKRGLMVINRKGKEAITEYDVLNEFGIYSWVQFQILTGRTHQIRVHMKEIGHPIACDNLYGDGKPVFLSSIKRNFKLSKSQEEERPILNRLALHAYQLKFTGPDAKYYQFEAPVPKDLKAILQQLEKRNRKLVK